MHAHGLFHDTATGVASRVLLVGECDEGIHVLKRQR